MDEVEDLSTFLSAVTTKSAGKVGTAFYRGHANREYLSLPKVFRDQGWSESEERLIRKIIEMHPEEFQQDSTTLERLVRAQHHGLPTRLLDVSLNPLVALYFCCTSEPNKDGEVVVYHFEPDRIKAFDSNTVSAIANTTLLKSSEKHALSKTINDHFSKSAPITISDFNAKAPLPRLLHFIQAEKPYFQPKIALRTLRQYVAVLPKRNNRRMIAQSGAFIVFAQNKPLNDDTSKMVRISRIFIPKGAKAILRTHLDQLNIHKASLFPEMSSASEYLARLYESPF
jgi:FRG domain